MNNKVKYMDIKNYTYYFFYDIIDKKIQYIDYLVYWICDDQRFEIHKKKQCGSFIPYFQQSKWIIKDLFRSMTKDSDDYDEKYMKIKFNSDDELPLNKMTEIPSMIIVIRAVFHENNKYSPQVFLDEFLYKLQIM